MKDVYKAIRDRAVPVRPIPKPGKKGKSDSKKRQVPAKLTPKQREKVFQKYGGLCAYCGHEIDLHNFQVDHKEAKSRFEDPKDANFWDNMMPSCRACNIRKNTMSIKRFRSELARDVEQLRRDSAKFRLLLKYGVIEIKEREIEFYFEKVKRGTYSQGR